MKKILLGTALLFVLGQLLPACQKEVKQSEQIKEITIDTTISTTADFRLDLTPYGDEGDIATILNKGTHSAISQLENETDMFTTVYHYSPSAKFSGTDSVVVAISQNPQGRTMVCKDSTIIYINLTIK